MDEPDPAEFRSGPPPPPRLAPSLFGPSRVVVGTLLGGPIAGGILIGVNLGRLGRKTARFNAILFSLAGTAALTLFLLEHEERSAGLIPAKTRKRASTGFSGRTPSTLPTASMIVFRASSRSEP